MAAPCPVWLHELEWRGVPLAGNWDDCVWGNIHDFLLCRRKGVTSYFPICGRLCLNSVKRPWNQQLLEFDCFHSKMWKCAWLSFHQPLYVNNKRCCLVFPFLLPSLPARQRKGPFQPGIHWGFYCFQTKK